MLIIPKKGYRVCLHCGKILLSRQIKNKECPYCGVNEKEETNGVLNDCQAKDLFKIVELKKNEFYLNTELEKKYTKMYDNCLIPFSVRI